MPYVTVDVEVDADEVLQSLSINQIEEVLAKKRKARDIAMQTPPMTPFDAKVLLDAAAMQLRKQGRNDLAYRLDEIREDYFQ